MKSNRIFFILIIPLILIFSGFHFLNTSRSHVQEDIEKTEIKSHESNRLLPSLNAFFSPDEDIKGRIIDFIRMETKAIWCAAFRLTDKEIAAELIDAHKRGIHLVFVIDKEGLSSIFSKLLHIFKNGITIYIYPPIDDTELYSNKSYNLKNRQKIGIKSSTINSTRGSNKGIMHNKFFIFHGLKTIITGSFNFTMSAQKINQENILIIKNHPVFNKYFEQFKKLCERSTKLSIN